MSPRGLNARHWITMGNSCECDFVTNILTVLNLSVTIRLGALLSYFIAYKRDWISLNKFIVLS